MNRYPLFSRILILALLALLLLIPLGMIESRIVQRQALQLGVQQDIARTAAGAQTLSGPYLVVHYRLREKKTTVDAKGRKKTGITETLYEEVISPRRLDIDGSATVETRSRGIYRARLFDLDSRISGEFALAANYGLAHPRADMTPVSAHFVVRVSDARGIRNVPLLGLNGAKLAFAPAATGTLTGNGMHAVLAPLSLDAQTLRFAFELELVGSGTLAIAPSGERTEMSLKATWPHPSFGGSYLPRSRSVDAKGFSAHWLVTHLARNSIPVEGAPQAEVFSVDFIDPVNVYLLSQRAVKYGVLFVVLVFTAFFMVEMLRRMRIHPLQYLLVGLAMAMFFLLIIALSEHVPFAQAYLAAATACVALIGCYLAGMLGAARPALMFSGGLALLYGVLYGVLQSEDNALLLGSLVLFAALAAVMLLTRRMDWYALGKPD